MNQVGYKITEFHENSIQVIAYGESDFCTFEFVMYKLFCCHMNIK